MLKRQPTLQNVSATLAGLFRVQANEVALLRLERMILRFLCPDHSRNTGATAAHTALSKKAEIFNNFAMSKHASVFEIISAFGNKAGDQLVPPPIQKLMSAPILGRESQIS